MYGVPTWSANMWPPTQAPNMAWTQTQHACGTDHHRSYQPQQRIMRIADGSRITSHTRNRCTLAAASPNLVAPFHSESIHPTAPILTQKETTLQASSPSFQTPPPPPPTIRLAMCGTFLCAPSHPATYMTSTRHRERNSLALYIHLSLIHI